LLLVVDAASLLVNQSGKIIQQVKPGLAVLAAVFCKNRFPASILDILLLESSSLLLCQDTSAAGLDFRGSFQRLFNKISDVR